MSFPPPPQKRSPSTGGNLSDDAKKNLGSETKRSNIWCDSKGENANAAFESGESVFIPLRRASPASTYSIDSSSGSNRTFVIQETDPKKTETHEGPDTEASPVKKTNKTTCEVDIHDFSQFESKSLESVKSAEVFVLNEVDTFVQKTSSPTNVADVFIVNELSGSIKDGSDPCSKTQVKPPVPFPRKSFSTLSSIGSGRSSRDIGAETKDKKVEVEDFLPSFSKQAAVAFSTNENELGSPGVRKPKPRKKKLKRSIEIGKETIELCTFKEKEEKPGGINEGSLQFGKEKDIAEQKNASEKSVVGVVIHGCDGLVTDLLVCHPLVRVYIVDQNTGEFLKKSVSGKPSNHDLAEYILPAMTQPFDFYHKKSIVPKWEELLVFNEAPEHLLKPTTLLLFEIIDLLSFSLADCQYAQFGSESAWHHVAWAFLKIINERNHSNLNKRLRLQLYRPKHKNLSPSKSKLPHLFWWYKSRSFKPYPSTLYITVKTTPVASELTSTIKSNLPVSQEARPGDSLQSLRLSHSESENIQGYAPENFNEKVLPEVRWTRLIGQSCKLPNSKLLSLNINSRGAFSVQFSWSGLLLASAASSQIYIHTIPQGQLFCQLPGHQGLIYSLRWSSDDSLLLSASADCTVCIWHIMEIKKPKLLQMLPHPSYIYCAIFINKYIIASGCHDGVVRLWLCTKKLDTYVLSQELSVHCGFVNSVCYCDGILYSADSVGVILSWNSQNDRWVLSKEYHVSELVGTTINHILMHPAGKRMIIHSRDSQLRMMDLATGAVIQWFQGCLNEQLQTGSCLSQCGSILFAWSEEGILVTWNTDTGEQIAIYSGDTFPAGCGCIHYHPHDHIAAFSVHSVTNNSSLVVAHFQREDPINSIGLTLVKKSSNEVDVKPRARAMEMEKVYGLLQGKQQLFSKPKPEEPASVKMSNKNINVTTVKPPKKTSKSSKRSLLAKSVSILSGSESNLLNEDILSKTEQRKKSEKWRSKFSRNISSIHSSSNKSLSVYDNLSFEMGEECLNKSSIPVPQELPDDLIHDPRLVSIINKIDKVLLGNQ